jgi:hypothetical protein
MNRHKKPSNKEIILYYFNELVLPNLLPKVRLLFLVELSTLALYSSTNTLEGNVKKSCEM